MAITSRKITTYVKNIVDLSDQPNKDGLTAAQLKAMFDGRTDEEVKASINGIVDDLVATTDGASGADQVGATPVGGGTGNTVQEVLEEIDTNAVHKTGNETIDDVKTFTSSPVVPTPTTDTQASTKKYVDDADALMVKKDGSIAMDDLTIGTRGLGSVGTNSVTVGSGNNATGKNSFAQGSSSDASEENSFAQGNYCEARGYCAHAEGTNTIAEGHSSHSEGANTIATGHNSHSEGSATVAQGIGSHAEGSVTMAVGESSHSANEATYARGKAQTAIGRYNILQGTVSDYTATDHAFIIGNGTAANRSNALSVAWNGDTDIAGDVNIASGKAFKINGSRLSASDVGATPIGGGVAQTIQGVLEEVANARYTKTNMQTSGQALLHWDNLTNVPNLADDHWKTPVANQAALPVTGNSLGDNRVVLDDGDGKQAVYTCVATTGTYEQQWSKVGDVDWMTEEATRQTQETARVNAEGTESPKSGRVGAELDRVANENARILAEGTADPRTGRIGAELDRVDEENARKSAEILRQAHINDKDNPHEVTAAQAGAVPTDAITNTLTETAEGNVLDARQGKVLADLISSNSQFTDTDDTVYSWRLIKSAEGHMQLEYMEVI